MRRKTVKDMLILLPAAGAFALLILRSGNASAAAQAGISNCLRTVIPALFPFLALTNLFLQLDFPKAIMGSLGNAFETLFAIRGAALPAFLAGFIGGYPIGAAAAAECCRLGRCSKEEAERLLVFANNCSPGFLFGLVSGKLPGGKQSALILLALQWLLSVFIGILLGAGQKRSKVASEVPGNAGRSFFEVFTASIQNAGRSTLLICAYVIFFGVITSFLPMSALLRGIVELTGGILVLSSGPQAEIIAAFLVGFGGLSVACQVMSALEGSGVSARRYLPLRLLHGCMMSFGIFCYHLGYFYILSYAALIVSMAVFVKTYGNRSETEV